MRRRKRPAWNRRDAVFEARPGVWAHGGPLGLGEGVYNATVISPGSWTYSAAHLAGQDDELVRVGPLLRLEPRWSRHLAADPRDATVRVLHRHEATGRPAGSARFLTRVEELLGRVVRPQRPGRKNQSP